MRDGDRPWRPVDVVVFDMDGVIRHWLPDSIQEFEQATATLMMYGSEIVGVELPPSVELTVAETEPGLQGDRSTGGTKPATLETGYVVQVPLFINTGEKLKIDTRTGQYQSRA